VRKILGSPAMLGATVKTDGTPVTDNEGMVVYRADALVSPRQPGSECRSGSRRIPVFTKVNTWLLTQVAFCATCKAPMYGTTGQVRRQEVRVLRLRALDTARRSVHGPACQG